MQPDRLEQLRRGLTRLRGRPARGSSAGRPRDVDAAHRERRLRALMLHMDLLLVVDAEGTVQFASPSAQQAFGLLDDGVGAVLSDFVHPDDLPATRAGMAEVVARPGSTTPFLVRVRELRGLRTHEVVAHNLLDDPEVGGVVLLSRDVTARRKSERAQDGQAQLLELIAAEAPLHEVLTALARWVEEQLDGTVCSVLLTDPDGGADLRNGASPSLPLAYTHAVEQASEAIRTSPCAQAVADGEPVLVPDLLADPRWELQRPLATATGLRACWSFPVASPATGQTLGTFALYRPTPGLPETELEALIARASHLVGIAVDRQRLLGRLAHQAHHDALTRLPNRLHLLLSLETALALAADGRAPAPVVVFLDLDRLKVINDSLGHDVGDELLVQVADRLRLAAPGDVVARFGGDEFVVLSTRLREPDEAVALVERVLAALAAPVELEGRTMTPAASAGVVVAQAPGLSATEVLRDADIAMYRAKSRGGGGYEVFGGHMRQRAFDRLDLEEQVRAGLAAGEFVVHYQPVVDLRADDRVVGFEALVRWQHPTRGLLLPGAFMDLVEETGLVVPIGEQVLQEACAAVRAWGPVGAGLTLSVNLSARQLLATGLPDLVARCAASVRPWELDLELVESTLMDDTAAVRAAVDRLAGSGARLSIDDFGTGYSSLAYLTRLPVQRLKIDRSFVADLGVRPEAASVAAAVIGLGHELGLTVVAEGVETDAQRCTLVELGCSYAQGYLFGGPVPADAARALLPG